MANERRIIQTDEKLPILQALPLAAQHLMAMFGATVLVPYLTGLDPAVGLMTSGIGTILYLIITRGKIPSYLGSSSRSSRHWSLSAVERLLQAGLLTLTGSRTRSAGLLRPVRSTSSSPPL